MKVLTIREPWVCFIRQGIKTTETRSRKTNYRGELYIHTGLKTDIVPTELRKQYDPAESFPGTICLKCILSDCILMDAEYIDKIKCESRNDYLCGDFKVGRYARILTDVQEVPPITARGKLGLWNYNIEESNVYDRQSDTKTEWKRRKGIS